MKITHIYIGSDHGGFELKQNLADWLRQENFSITDCGATELNPEDDYPEFAKRVSQPIFDQAESPTQDPTVMGILLCRSGVGMAMVANRFSSVRAAICRNLEEASLARRHNNANVLVLEGDHLSPDLAREIAEIFFTTEFDGGRHARRLEQIGQIDEQKTSTVIS